MFVSIGEAAALLCVHVQTIRRWEREGSLKPAFRTPGGHRRYRLSDIRELMNDCETSDLPKKKIVYGRVSSSDQKEDLTRQIGRLQEWAEQYFDDYETLKDIGSGLNFKKRGFKKLIRMILQGQVSDLVITHRDRLLRFGNELLFQLAEHYGVKIHVIEEETEISDEQRLIEEMLSLITVFSARLYGKRSHKNRIAKAA